jgi:hypothetical protein
LANDEKDDEQRPFHMEGSSVIFDKPPSAKETGRETREREAHEFAGRQVRINNRTAWFNGLLVLATFATVVIGIWQGNISQRASLAASEAANAASYSAYMGCLSTQASQITFSQLRKGASDSHAATLATIEEANAGVAAQQASIIWQSRFPTAAELYNGRLAIPIIIKNIGKSTATDASIRIKAVLLYENEKLVFDNKNLENFDSRFVPAGSEYPEKSTDPIYKAFTPMLNVRDVTGNLIPAKSQQTTDFLDTGRSIVVMFGHLSFTDFSGKHRSEFCTASFIGIPGTTRKATSNEIVCKKHNHDETEYFALPKIENALQTEASSPQPVVCEKPRSLP